MTMCKVQTPEEVEEWDAFISSRYADLLDESSKLVEHMMKTYEASQSEEDCDLLIEASQQQTKIMEDAANYEIERINRRKTIRDAFAHILDDASERAEAKSLKDAIKRIDDAVSQLRHQAQHKRQGFSQQVKADLIKATEAMGGKCPCCGEQAVVSDGVRCNGGEFDHFFANHIARVDAGWLICQKCHRSLTHNAGLRTEKTAAFVAFQTHRKTSEAQQQINISSRAGE